MGGYFDLNGEILDLGIIREETIVKNVPLVAIQSPTGDTKDNVLAVFLAGTKEVRIIGSILFSDENSKNNWIRKLDASVKGMKFNAVRYYPKSFLPYSSTNYLLGYISNYFLRFSEVNINLVEYDITFTEGVGVEDWI